MQKKVDEEIKTLVENDVKVRHWSMFFFMGACHMSMTMYLSLLKKHCHF
ncbi:hypothetical protein MtrunA17_Chr5g0430891 [Medicago truncatula]|uniref:Transmembrane protein n=1 Tax=Medicago truncatula TaxID=3880 RepID=A0A396HVJ9_MEDTR|nr:hypothetical protein MtrunA17_Chr5g0430891 [Medicago truncatula]